MADGSTIEWLVRPGTKPATLNPVRGCTRKSEGCRNCYAEIMAARFSKPGMWGHGFAEMRGGDHRWTGKVALIADQLAMPFSWREPRTCFVNSTSDLFHEALSYADIDRVMASISQATQHTFIVLSKRADVMHDYIKSARIHEITAAARDLFERKISKTHGLQAWPLPNLWLGVSVEDQQTADERIPQLLKTPAAVHFISAEPLLGPINLARWLLPKDVAAALVPMTEEHIAMIARNERKPVEVRTIGFLDWIIAGGESGPGARPMHPAWARSIRAQCQAAGVPFFFKQWGEFVSVSEVAGPGAHHTFPDGATVRRTGKKLAGALLDGREWKEFPA